MPFCPKCGAEFVQGIALCSDCGVELVDTPPVSQEPGKPELTLVEVWRASHELEAQMVRGLLESHGIDCALKGEAVRLTHSIAVDGLAEVRILVRPEDVQRAKRILAFSDKDSKAESEPG